MDGRGVIDVIFSRSGRGASGVCTKVTLRSLQGVPESVKTALGSPPPRRFSTSLHLRMSGKERVAFMSLLVAASSPFALRSSVTRLIGSERAGTADKAEEADHTRQHILCTSKRKGGGCSKGCPRTLKVVDTLLSRRLSTL